jgi:hypothetical protein
MAYARMTDYEVIWRHLAIGRILKLAGNQHWWWGVQRLRAAADPNDRGPGLNFKDCQVRFNLVWARIRPTLTEEAIAIATRHGEGLKRQQSGGKDNRKPRKPFKFWRTSARHRGSVY